MKILFLSWWGASLPLAIHCQENGHEVKLFVDDKESKEVGDGFVPKVDDYKSHVEWADLVITDSTHLGSSNDAIREKGIPVIGGSKMTDALEEDRGMGQRLFESVGMESLESEEFKTIEETISYVQENPGKYVVKVSGAAQDDKSTTYVGQTEDGSDIISVLEHMEAKGIKKLEGVQVQECKEGIEVAITGFFNGDHFVGKCFVNFEHKKIMPWNTQQGIGPNTGEMGCSAFWMDQDIGLFKKVLKPMEKPLKKMGYRGAFDINCMVSEGKIYPLEMTNRFGWPTLPLMIETLKENDLAEFFYAIASGEDFELEISYPISLYVMVGAPPLPYISKDIFEKYTKGMPVLLMNGLEEGIYPGEIKLEDDQWVVAGNEGCLVICAAGGYSIEECQTKAYELSDHVIVPNKMIRDDVGRTTDDAMDQLNKMGLLGIKEEVSS